MRRPGRSSHLQYHTCPGRTWGIFWKPPACMIRPTKSLGSYLTKDETIDTVRFDDESHRHLGEFRLIHEVLKSTLISSDETGPSRNPTSHHRPKTRTDLSGDVQPTRSNQAIAAVAGSHERAVATIVEEPAVLDHDELVLEFNPAGKGCDVLATNLHQTAKSTTFGDLQSKFQTLFVLVDQHQPNTRSGIRIVPEKEPERVDRSLGRTTSQRQHPKIFLPIEPSLHQVVIGVVQHLQHSIAHSLRFRLGEPEPGDPLTATLLSLQHEKRRINGRQRRPGSDAVARPFQEPMRLVEGHEIALRPQLPTDGVRRTLDRDIQDVSHDRPRHQHQEKRQSKHIEPVQTPFSFPDQAVLQRPRETLVEDHLSQQRVSLGCNCQIFDQAFVRGFPSNSLLDSTHQHNPSSRPRRKSYGRNCPHFIQNYF